jgi:hypothetical protein
MARPNHHPTGIAMHVLRTPVAFVLMLLVSPLLAAPPAAELSPPAKTILDQLETSGDFDAADKAATELFEQTILSTRPTAPQPLKDAAFVHRLVGQLKQADSTYRLDLLKWLRTKPNLAAALAFAIREPQDKPLAVFGVLDKLRRKFDAKLEDYANLTAAMCVVHDVPLVHRINENKAEAADVCDIFEFYTNNEKQMLFGLKAVPPELLIYVVDNSASLAEMNWALTKYVKNQHVGQLFHSIKYDYASLQGAVKKSTAAGWGLQNILKYGGVCADQAYFAVSVGKCIGVPTVYTTASSGEVGHAWVGYLEQVGAKGRWNFDEGRFGTYTAIKGNVTDPQTRQKIPDSFVGVLAEMIGAKMNDRHTAVALVDAAHRLMETESSPIQPTGDTKAVRTAKPEASEEFVDKAITLAAGYPDAWMVVRELAKADKLTSSKKNAWVTRLQKVCGDKYPDFTMAILKPMIESIKDTTEQNKLWEVVYKMFAKRLDLAAEVRVSQGEMWLAAGDVKQAGMAYEKVITGFANAGPFVINALKRTEELLIKANHPDRVVDLYAQTWARTERPKQMGPEFFTQSNWFKIGKLYVAKLETAGQNDKAAKVRGDLESASGVKLAGNAKS